VAAIAPHPLASEEMMADSMDASPVDSLDAAPADSMGAATGLRVGQHGEHDLEVDGAAIWLCVGQHDGAAAGLRVGKGDGA